MLIEHFVGRFVLNKKIDLLKLYFLIFSLGLIQVSEYISIKITSKFNFQSFKNSLCDWAAYYTGSKLFELSFFLVCITSLALLYFFLYWLNLNTKNNIKHKLSSKIFLVLLVSSISNIYIFKYAPLSGKTVLFYLILFFLGLTYFIRDLGLEKKDWITFPFFSNRVYFFICLATVIHIFSYTYPLVMHPMLIENDYMDIPEKTVLANKKIIDNTRFINDHLSHEVVKYDPRVDDGKDPKVKEVASIKIDTPKLLKLFFDFNSRRKYFYGYSKGTGELKIFHRYPDDDELNDLKEIFYQIKSQLDIFYLESHARLNQLSKIELSEDELEFLKINKLELSTQAKAGWFLFHHSWVINPLHAVALGDAFSNQVLIYGFASSMWLKKVLDMMGGVNYQNYFKATFILYPIYFISFLLGIWCLFRNLKMVAIGGMALGLCYLAISYQLLVLAPGFNPLRHFWDIWGFVLLNEYLKKDNKLYLIGAISLGLFAIIWSKDFGIALYLGIIVALFIKKYSKQSLYAFAFATSLLILGCIVYFLPINGKNYNMLYMLIGVTVPQASKFLIYFVLVVTSLSYALLFNCFKEKSNQFILVLGIFIYAQIVLIYYIWYPSIHHLISNATGIILFGLILLDFDQAVIDKNLLSKMFTSFLVIAYIFSTYFFYIGRAETLQLFRQHLIYDWNFEKAKFKSTMEPELFYETVDLIQKYSNSNSIYLISKYDAILPVVSNKYNKIPAVSVALDMIGKKDIARMARPILKNKPEYIFVDTDILRNYVNDIYNIYGELGRIAYDESIGRVTVMDNMKMLFLRIHTKYELIEKGRLISVYKFKG